MFQKPSQISNTVDTSNEHTLDYSTLFCIHGATANNELTLNSKDRKMPSLGSQTTSIIAFQDLSFISVAAYQVATLVKA